VPEKLKSHAKNIHPRPTTRLWERMWRPASLFAVVLLAYLPSAHMSWIYDDHVVILAQAPRRSFGDFAHIFAERHFPNLPYYRPITRSTLLLQKFWHGDRPAYFHFGNATLAGLTALLAYFLIRLPAFRLHPNVALFGAALFALHPVASSCVYPISSGRETLIPALWTILALCAFLRSGRSWQVLAWFGFIGALLSKEQAVVIPLLFVLADVLKLSDLPAERPWSLWIKRYLAVVASLLAYFAIRQGLFGTSQYEFGSLSGPFLAWLYAVQTIFAPTLELVYEPTRQIWWSPLKLGFALSLFAALCMVAFRLGRRVQAALFFWTGWIVLTLLPTSNLLRQEAPYDERYVFLASLGVVGVLGIAASSRWQTMSGSRWIGGTAVALIALCASISIHRASYFKDDFTFGWQWLKTNPASFNAHYNLGLAFNREGKAEAALVEYTEAVRINPVSALARNNLGSTLFEMGKVEESIPQFLEALRIDANYADAHFNLGNALAQQGKRDEAILHLQQAVSIEPNKANFHNNLGNALASAGKVEQAMEHFKDAVRLLPDYAEAYNNLGVALVNQGKLAEGIAQFNEALRFKPGYGDALRNRQIIFAELQKSQK